MQGSVSIQGAIAIGKTSLLAHVRLIMEGWKGEHSSVSAVSTGHKDIKTVDEDLGLLITIY